MCGKDIPAWVNRIANIGSRLPWVYNCLPKDWLTPEPEEPDMASYMFHPEQHRNNINCKLFSGAPKSPPVNVQIQLTTG